MVEKIGIEKSKASFNAADLIIFMLDTSREIDHEDLEIASYIGERKALVLANKSDLKKVSSHDELMKLIPNGKLIETSMEKGNGIEEIKDEIERLVFGGEIKQNESLIITNLRHLDLLRNSLSSLQDGINMAKQMEALEFIEVDVKKCYELLGEITGESVTDDILNEVFSRFCLGK